MKTNYSDNVNILLNEARRLADVWGHTYVDSEHILLAMTSIKCGAAQEILLENGMTFPSTKKDIKDFLGM